MRTRRLTLLLAVACVGTAALRGARGSTSLEIQDPSFEQANVSGSAYAPFFATSSQDPQWNPAWLVTATDPTFVGLFLNPADYSTGPGTGALTYSSAPAGSPPNGNNVGFIAAANGTEIKQALFTSANSAHETFSAGSSYALQVGLAKSLFEPPTPPVTVPATASPSLVASLEWVDSLGNWHIIPGASTTVSADVLSNSNVQFFSVSLPTVLSTDNWSGQQIGISLAASSAANSGGEFDFDAFSVVAVPEPSGLLLLAAAPLALLVRPHRRLPE